jgi:outer membrane scaffolding protein for murein synthesis (MipA/OmpV family)
MRTTACIHRTLIAGALFAAACAPVHADEKPLWEVGLGTGVLTFNDYRGANAAHVWPVPIPYFVFRGDILKVDREGLRGKLFRQDRVELNLSIDATTPVRNDSARAGMPDLRSTLQIGPELDVHLWRSADRRVKLDLRTSVSAAITIASDPERVGTIYDAHLALDIAQFRGEYGWKLGLLAGPLWANRHYNNYFYGVGPQYATPTRPAYDAPGGYAGTQTLISLTRRYPSFWVGAFLRHDSLAGASFESSPLVQRNSYWFGGFGVVWILHQSSRLVESEE